jgi:SHQ1 protein
VLIYPYLRSFPLGIVIWEHIASILVHQDSIRIIIRCLLQIRSILDRSDMYYLGNKLYIDPYLIWIQQYRAHSDDHHPDAAAAAPSSSGGKSNNYIATNFLLPMANSIRQQLLCGDSNHIHPMKDNLGLNLLQIDTELLNCHEDEDEDDNESEADHQHSQNDIHSDTDESNASDSDAGTTASDNENDSSPTATSKVDENSLSLVPITTTNMKQEQKDNNGHNNNDDIMRSDDSLDALKLCNEFESLSTTEKTTTGSPSIQDVDL